MPRVSGNGCAGEGGLLVRVSPLSICTRIFFWLGGGGEVTRATNDRGILFFGENGFWVMGLLNPKSSEIKRRFVLHGSCCVPRTRDFSSCSSLVFDPNQFLGEVGLS